MLLLRVFRCRRRNQFYISHSFLVVLLVVLSQPGRGHEKVKLFFVVLALLFHTDHTVSLHSTFDRLVNLAALLHGKGHFATKFHVGRATKGKGFGSARRPIGAVVRHGLFQVRQKVLVVARPENVGVRQNVRHLRMHGLLDVRLELGWLVKDGRKVFAHAGLATLTATASLRAETAVTTHALFFGKGGILGHGLVINEALAKVRSLMSHGAAQAQRKGKESRRRKIPDEQHGEEERGRGISSL